MDLKLYDITHHRVKLGELRVATRIDAILATLALVLMCKHPQVKVSTLLDHRIVVTRMALDLVTTLAPRIKFCKKVSPLLPYNQKFQASVKEATLLKFVLPAEKMCPPPLELWTELKSDILELRQLAVKAKAAKRSAATKAVAQEVHHFEKHSPLLSSQKWQEALAKAMNLLATLQIQDIKLLALWVGEKKRCKDEILSPYFLRKFKARCIGSTILKVCISATEILGVPAVVASKVGEFYSSLYKATPIPPEVQSKFLEALPPRSIVFQGKSY